MSTVVFDRKLSDERMEEGLAIATSPEDRQMWLKEAREVAIRLATIHGAITIEDVVFYYSERGIDITEKLGKASGALFRAKEFNWTGRVARSARVSRNSSMVLLWELA